jgi:hypothetical protein
MLWKGMALVHDKSFQMRATEDFLRRVDNWRRQQSMLPSRAEAIRRLVELGLEAAEGGKSGDVPHERSPR